MPNTSLATPAWVAAQTPADWLMPPELAVLESWPSPKRRAEWLAGRLAVKRLLRESFDIDPLVCRIGRDGVAPVIRGSELPEIVLSLSHSGGLGAASFCEAAEGEVGVDVQRIRPVHRRLAARVFTKQEREQIDGQEESLLLLWALKEAAIKARRQPWGRALCDLEVRLTGSGRADIFVPGETAQAAQYVRVEGGWWLARSLRPPAIRPRNATPDATAETGR